MTDLHEDIIVDLLPLYYSGDASAATRATVEAYLAAHPDFAATMREAMAASPKVPGNAAPTDGVRTIKRVRSQVALRGALIGLGIFFSLMPCTFIYAHGRLVYFMWRDAPGSAALYAGLALVAWIALFVTIRRTNKL